MKDRNENGDHESEGFQKLDSPSCSVTRLVTDTGNGRNIGVRKV